MFYSTSIKRGGPSDDPMNLVVFFQQKFSQVRSILPGDSSKKGNFSWWNHNIKIKIIDISLTPTIPLPPKKDLLITNIHNKHFNRYF